MLLLLLVMAGFCLAAGIVYPAVTVIILRLMGDRRPLRELLEEI